MRKLIRRLYEYLKALRYKTPYPSTHLLLMNDCERVLRLTKTEAEVGRV